ncbi:MAG: hypothetical protein LBR15_02875 [Methanobrevibacter sp.]|nr:hypothetical protein [Candidatus Methanovirga australis]
MEDKDNFNVINFLIGKKEGWTPFGHYIMDKFSFLWFLPNKHRLSISKCLIILFLLMCILTGGFNNSNTNKISQKCEIKDVSIYEYYGSVKITANIRWIDNDHTSAYINGQAHLKDGTIKKLSYIQSFDHVIKNEWYKLDGSAYLGSSTKLSDVSSIDLIGDSKIIYTWNN